ncbi:MAG TPA: lipase maturation factor family protein [Myxococcota bacterium]|nr:lipase maturation factor family protein [Myxococcota bacterium]
MDVAARDVRLVAACFLRLLGLVSLCAFASLWVQLDGLIGARGIAPASQLLAFARDRLGSDAFLRLPTWLWLLPSDAGLHALCASGVVASLALAAGRGRRTALAIAWSSYLSLCVVGDVFLSYQWDALLLETLAVAAFATARDARLARLGIWLPRALLVKLMAMSGLVKWLSGDPAWRDGTALTYHWWTQPLPTWTSVLAARAGPVADAFSTYATLAIELAAPVAALGPRPLRLGACAALALLQLVIAATGNYGFFNLLALALCLTLLDDDALRALVPRTLRARIATSRAPSAPAPPARLAAFALAGAFVLSLSLLAGLAQIAPPIAESKTADVLLGALAPLRTFNGYGLFAVMTKQRDEILVEGTADGRTWRPYAFRWKPGALDRRPRFATPHLPRLDWQMWFAALGSCARERWLHAFLARLLEGSPEVTALLATNPFPDAPPRALRTTIASYRFAPPGTPDWWVRGEPRPYCPTVRLEGGRLAVDAPE